MPHPEHQGPKRSLTPASVLACALLAAAVVLGSQPWSAEHKSGTFLEMNIETSRAGVVQVFYDLGHDFKETESVSVPITANKPEALRFELPYGTIYHLRLDPLDIECRAKVGNLRIVGPFGRVIREFSPRDLSPRFQVSSVDVQGDSTVIVCETGATDPSVNIRMDSAVSIGRSPVLARLAGILGICVAAILLLSRAWNHPRLNMASWLGASWKAACRSPCGSTALVALLSTLAANYPVVFAGKSFVSPGLGVAMLYGQSPWLPGARSADAGEPNRSDVGAVIWHHLPLSMLERKALFEDGELPLWNRYDSAGVPLLGQGQSCFGDPLQVLPIVANGAAWAWDVKFLMAKWIFSLGIGICAWRAFGHLPTALILAASSAFIGYFVFRINHPAIFSLSYAPWILYCWFRCAVAPNARLVIFWLAGLIGANWCEMNSGTAKEAYALLFSMNFAGLCVLLASERPVREKLGLLMGGAAAGAIFAMISAPVWFTFYRALKTAYTSYNAPLAFQIQPGMLAGLFDEAFYRPFQEESGVVNPSVNFLILAGLLWSLVRLRVLLADRRAVALLVGAAPAAALVFGLVPPGFVAGIPFLGNILHVDNAFSCALVVILSVLSGFGIRDALLRLGSSEGRREAALVTWLVVGLLAVYFGTAQSVVRSAYADHTWGKVIAIEPFIYVYALSLIVGVGILLRATGSILCYGATATSVVLLVMAVCLLHWREGFKTGLEFPGYVVRPTDRQQLDARSAAVQTLQERAAEPAREVGFHNDILPGWNIAYRLEGISGPDALSNPYYRDLMDSAGVRRVWDWRYIVETTETAELRPLLDSLNVRYFAGYHVAEDSPDPKLVHVTSQDMEVFESKTAWPRAFFTDSVAIYADTKQYCSWIKAGDGRPFVGIQRSDWEGLSGISGIKGDLGSRTIVAATDYRITTNSTSFTVKATGPGVIALSEAYEADNFRAWLNGQRVAYTRVNHAFKGILVESAGTYEVKFTYWPRGLSTSLGFFYFGSGLLVALLALAQFGLRRDERILNAGDGL